MLNPDVEGSGDYKHPKNEDEELQQGQIDEQRNRTRTWETFSNHEASDGNNVVSVEAWHDYIHYFVGNGAQTGASGHMGDPAVAGVRFSFHSFSELSNDFLASSTQSSGCITGESAITDLRYV